MLQLRGSVHEGFVVTRCATLAAVKVSVIKLLFPELMRVQERNQTSYSLGRKERGLFFLSSSAKSSVFYRYSLWVFLIELKAYLLGKATT